MSAPQIGAAPPLGAADGKAKLLLQRERELFELRHLRSRAEEWFNALHAVWPGRFDLPLEALAQRAAELLVGELSFEYAAALEYEPATGRLVFGCGDPRPLPEGLKLEPATLEHLDARQVGRYVAEPNDPLAPFAERLNLAKFFWRSCLSGRATCFLLLAGSSQRTAQFHTFPDSDRDHFAMFASHVAALLTNSWLIADVQREQAELEAANRGLDASLRELEQTQAKLVASTQMVALASRQAGMAEIATGILHNVGNVLNSVNVCGEVALDRVMSLPVEGLAKISELLAGEADLSRFFAADPRAPKALAYLRQLSTTLADERTAIARELSQLTQHLGHVAAIVTRQQAYARARQAEPCRLAELMDDALLLARSSHHQGRIEVVRAFQPAPLIEVDRHRVLQILVNLISNALQALHESTRPDKRLTAHIGVTPSGKIRLAIEDNGVGIAPEHAARLFQHGFTTRATGHGFGLHNSFLTAQELGGELSFQSPGPGLGATFALELSSELVRSEEDASRAPSATTPESHEASPAPGGSEGSDAANNPIPEQRR